MHPLIDIDVDEKTGIWTTDGFPMIYVPRHFMVNLHRSIEAALGRDAYKSVLDDAGGRSAFTWCDGESKARHLDGMGAFRHYLDRLSARGWGQFEVVEFDLIRETATIHLRNSVYVLQAPQSSDETACYMFEGFLAGGFQFVLQSLGSERTAVCRETQCAANGGEHCVFQIDTI